MKKVFDSAAQALDGLLFDGMFIASGGFVSVRTGSAPEANSIPIPKHHADRAMEAAACIGCGACAAACPNASAMLFTAAKVSHLAFLPQGQPERDHGARSPAAVDLDCAAKGVDGTLHHIEPHAASGNAGDALCC